MPTKLTVQDTPVLPHVPDANVRLLLHGNGAADGTSFPDDSTLHETVTAHGTISTQANPNTGLAYNGFSASSIRANGGYLTAGPQAGIALGTADFSWECFFYPTAADFGFLFDTRAPGDTGASGFVVAFSWPGSPDQRVSFGSVPGPGGTWVRGPAITLDAWHHIVVTRVGGVARLVIDRVVAVTVPWPYDITGQHVFVGTDNRATVPVYGYLNEVRLVAGRSAYPGMAYPAPTGPLPSVPTPPPPPEPARPALTGSELLVWRCNDPVEVGLLANSIVLPDPAPDSYLAPYNDPAFEQETGSFELGVVPGVGNYFTGADTVPLSDSALTASCWVKLTAGPGWTQAFIEKIVTAGSLKPVTIGQGFGFTNNFIFRTHTEQGGYCYKVLPFANVTPTPVVVGDIVFLAMTVDNAGNFKCYVNGVEQTNFSNTYGTASGKIAVGDGPWTLGAADSGAAAWTVSPVWEVRVNTAILSEATLLSQYKQGAGIP